MEKDIIKNSKTKSQAVRSIYGYDNGTSRRKFEKLIKENEIDISHLTKQPFIYERKIKDYAVGMDALLKSERIKEEIFNMEHDLWEF
ncbi:MAG: hypothetical protein ACK455_09120 [Bacteroidota bacterium]